MNKLKKLLLSSSARASLLKLIPACIPTNSFLFVPQSAYLYLFMLGWITQLCAALNLSCTICKQSPSMIGGIIRSTIRHSITTIGTADIVATTINMSYFLYIHITFNNKLVDATRGLLLRYRIQSYPLTC